ncbi:MAG: type II secretion system minor pseudopilin GspJ [Burkholderiales bacterium]|jgi:general secretion pathway protein J|nr:type II secretion system minor pseudopilin GspJ [Burkholderiales bacterium]
MKRITGFTLMEVLIALMIFATISVLAYRAVGAMTDSEFRLSQEAAHWRLLEQFFTRFEADARQALPRPMMDGNRKLPAWQTTNDGRGRLSLQFARAATRLPAAVGTQQGQRIAYEWRDGHINIQYWPAFDNVPSAVPQTYRLLDDVTLFHVDYLTQSDSWVENWSSSDEAALPRAMRVRIAMRNSAIVERIFALQ